MASYAQIENGVVVNVIVADADFINAGHVGDPASWVEVTDGKKYGIGYAYSEEHNGYIPPKYFASWVFSIELWDWEPPLPPPMSMDQAYRIGIYYTWNEATLAWDTNEIPADQLSNVIDTIEQQRAEGTT